MNQKTPWADHPNAIHIDRILSSYIANPTIWRKRENKYNVTKTADAFLRAFNGLSSCNKELYDSTASMLMFGHIPIDTAACLLAYDDCGYMLDSDPGELAILAKFGDDRAVLLLHACIIFAEEKKLA